MRLRRNAFSFLFFLALTFSVAGFCAAKPEKIDLRSSTPAKLLNQAQVPYPDRSKEIGEEGTTWLKVFVQKNGGAKQVEILRSSGSPDLDERAEIVARKSSYAPGTKNGKSIDSWLTMPVAAVLPELVKGDQQQIDALKQKISRSPQDAKLYEALGLLYLQEKRWAEAKKAYFRASNLDPSNVDTRVLLGNAELEMKDFLQAQKDYEKALSFSPDDPQANAGIAKAYISMGKRDEALRFYEEAAKLNPDNPSVFSALGNLLVSLNRQEEALPYLEKARQLDPGNFTVLQGLGFIYYQRKDYAKAADVFEQAVKLRPDNPVLYENLGSALLSSGNVKEAVSVLEKTVQLDPNNAGTYYSLGVAYIEQKEFDKARPVFEKAIELLEARKASGDVLGNAYLELGLTLFQLGEKEKAVLAIEKASKLRPKDPDILLSLAEGYESLKQIDKAIPAYMQFIQVSPESAEAHERLGYLYFAKGDQANSKEEFHAALKLYTKSNNEEKVKSMKDNLKKLGAPED